MTLWVIGWLLMVGVQLNLIGPKIRWYSFLSEIFLLFWGWPIFLGHILFVYLNLRAPDLKDQCKGLTP